MRSSSELGASQHNDLLTDASNRTPACGAYKGWGTHLALLTLARGSLSVGEQEVI